MTKPYLRSLVHIARRVYPDPTWSDRGQRTLFVLRHLCKYRYSKKWLEYLATGPLALIAQENPSLYRKPIRPYLSINWTNRAKIAAMIYHYDFLACRLAPAVFRQVVSPAGCVLLSFPAKNGDQLTIRLRFDGKFRKEGETTLDLESAQYSCRVSSLTFVAAASESGAPSLVIGAVSGLPAGVDKDVIKNTAKALFGLRPKALLVLLLQELARAWEVPALFGVGSRIHTSRHLIYALNRSRRFAITYDSFWREIGGIPRSDGFFNLPLVVPARDLKEIEAHKRSLYRQRYALIDRIRDDFHSSLRSWRADPMVSARNGGEFIPPAWENAPAPEFSLPLGDLRHSRPDLQAAG